VSEPVAPVLVQVRDLTKRFGSLTAVDGVSLDILKGELFAILGGSGCGKTTLLRMLAGFEQPTSGRILIDGSDMTDVPPYERPVNLMFQSYALFPHMTVEQNVAYGLRKEGVREPQIRERVAEMLSLVKLGLVYAAATWAILFVSDLIDGGALDALIEAQAAGDTPQDVMAARLGDPRLEMGVLLRFALLGLLSVPFWHAPALVHWDGQTAGKSLFFSTVACWRNKGAFVVYSVAWLGVLPRSIAASSYSGPIESNRARTMITG